MMKQSMPEDKFIKWLDDAEARKQREIGLSLRKEAEKKRKEAEMQRTMARYEAERNAKYESLKKMKAWEREDQ
jgi:hypothetical protein